MENRTDTQVLQLVTKNLPWILLGLVMLLGGGATIIYGLPWAQKTDVDKLTADMKANHESIEKVSETQAVAAEQQRQTAALLTNIENRLEKQEESTEQNSIHIEGLEADEKARDSHEALHGR